MGSTARLVAVTITDAKISCNIEVVQLDENKACPIRFTTVEGNDYRAKLSGCLMLSLGQKFLTEVKDILKPSKMRLKSGITLVAGNKQLRISTSFCGTNL